MNQEQTASVDLDVKLPELFVWRELAILGLMLMDLSWGIIWIDVLAILRPDVELLDLFLIFGAAILGAHVLYRGMVLFQLKLTVQRGVLLVYLILITVIAFRRLLPQDPEAGLGGIISQPVQNLSDLGNLFPGEFVIVLAVLFFGWRGLKLGQEFIGPRKVLSSFRLGFLMFLIYVVVFTTLTGRSPGFTWILFLGAGLMALASARVAMLAVIRGGRRNPFNREWFLGLVVAIGGTLFLSAGIAVFAAGVGGFVVGILVRLVIGLLFLIIYPVIFVITYVVVWIVEMMQLEEFGVTSGLTAGFERLSTMFEGLSEYAADFSWFFEGILDLWLRWGPLVKLLVCSSVIFLVALVVILQLRERANRRRLSALGDADLDRTQEGLLNQLTAALRNTFSANFGRRERSQFKPNLAAVRVRQIYAEMSELAKDLGNPRRIAQTPREYTPVLNKLFVNMETEISQITDAYIRVRYGELPENQAELEDLEAAWERVESFGKQRLKSQPGKSA